MVTRREQGSDVQGCRESRLFQPLAGCTSRAFVVYQDAVSRRERFAAARPVTESVPLLWNQMGVRGDALHDTLHCRIVALFDCLYFSATRTARPHRQQGAAL